MRVSVVLIAIFGILLPAVTLVVELTTGLCAKGLFNPIPTPVHTALVALVPIGNLTILIRTRESSFQPTLWDFLLIGTVIATCAAYSFVFIPLTFAAIRLIPFWGLGLCPLAPLASLLSSLSLSVMLYQRAGVAQSKFGFGSIWSTGGACILFCCLAGVLWSSFIERDFLFSLFKFQLF